jgi:hypothetical protein
VKNDNFLQNIQINMGEENNNAEKKRGWYCTSPTRSITLKFAKENPQHLS